MTRLQSGAARERDERGQHALAPFVYLGIVAVGLGAAALLYRGAGRALIRGHLADVASTVLVYALLSLCMRRTRARGRGAWTMLVAAVVELTQGDLHARCSCQDALGDTLDWLDFGAYAIGIGVAMAWERILDRLRRISTNPHAGQDVGSS